MDGENSGSKPNMNKWMIWGGFPPIFGSTPICLLTVKWIVRGYTLVDLRNRTEKVSFGVVIYGIFAEAITDKIC